MACSVTRGVIANIYVTVSDCDDDTSADDDIDGRTLGSRVFSVCAVHWIKAITPLHSNKHWELNVVKLKYII